MTDEKTVVTRRPTPPATGKCRRKHPRIDISLQVNELSPEVCYLRASSLSVGGLYCPEALPRPLGSHLLLELQFQDKRPPMIVAGNVRRTGEEPDGRGIGVEFCTPQTQLRTIIRERSSP